MRAPGVECQLFKLSPIRRKTDKRCGSHAAAARPSHQRSRTAGNARPGEQTISKTGDSMTPLFDEKRIDGDAGGNFEVR
jgi:hypothetical protein